METDVAVIGAGVSGLATAHALSTRGYRVTVLERQVRPGGNAISERFGGFLMEHGPTSVNAASALANEGTLALGLDAQKIGLGPRVRRRYLTKGETLHGIPTHPLGFLTSGYMSLRGRARLLAEIAVPKEAEPIEETVAAFFDRRFGREFTERVIDPLAHGVFAGSAETLSVRAAFPRLVELERDCGSVIRAILRSRRGGRPMPGSRLVSWRGGMGAVPAALAGALGANVRTGVAVRCITRTHRGFLVDAGASGNFEAAAVVVATQPHVAAGLIEGVDADGAAAAGSIEAPPISVVFLGYRRGQVPHALDGIGYLTPSGEGRALSGALFCSTMFPGRAPPGHVALAAYIGGARAPDLAGLPPDDLIGLARDEFGDLLGARGDPVVARVRQWARGLPLYGLGHRATARTLADARRRVPGLCFAGNYLSGVSVAACYDCALETADQVRRHLMDAGVRNTGREQEPSRAFA